MSVKMRNGVKSGQGCVFDTNILPSKTSTNSKVHTPFFLKSLPTSFLLHIFLTAQPSLVLAKKNSRHSVHLLLFFLKETPVCIFLTCSMLYVALDADAFASSLCYLFFDHYLCHFLAMLAISSSFLPFFGDLFRGFVPFLEALLQREMCCGIWRDMGPPGAV